MKYEGKHHRHGDDDLESDDSWLGRVLDLERRMRRVMLPVARKVGELRARLLGGDNSHPSGNDGDHGMGVGWRKCSIEIGALQQRMEAEMSALEQRLRREMRAQTNEILAALGSDRSARAQA